MSTFLFWLGCAMIFAGFVAAFVSLNLLCWWCAIEGRLGLRRWFLGLPHDEFADPRFRPRVAGVALLVGSLIAAYHYA